MLILIHRFVSRDLGGGDPEIMAPPRFADYVKEIFSNSIVSVDIIDKIEEFEKEYPLFAAVNRAASGYYLSNMIDYWISKTSCFILHSD